MKFNRGKAEEVKIAYIGGGSRGWAWTLMTDLAGCDKMSGEVYLYDIDYDAAKRNEAIGARFNEAEGALSRWNYRASKTIDEALSGADFVIISILPGTFDEMESDVHTPEKYGIYQPVGDTTGPGGVIRALRTIPMFEYIAAKVEENCPRAWVINYTNPMSLCVGALYRTFPGIKAIGCCHEVFGTQKLLMTALDDILGIKCESRSEIKVNVVGVNHFTWLTEAKYRNIDLFPVYRAFCEKYRETGYVDLKDSFHKWDEDDSNVWKLKHKVKMDLFLRYGAIAAAGDRHLAEFCPGKWYLDSVEAVRKKWAFNLTPVSYRRLDLRNRLKKSDDYYEGRVKIKIGSTGEEGVMMLCALLGLGDLVTNVNIPNVGQIPNLPLGAIVETNAVMRADEVSPVMAGNLPVTVYPLVSRIVGEQEQILNAAVARDLDAAFAAFAVDPLVGIPLDDARALFDEMIENTKKYLGVYGI
ncbi:MAG: alpha-glucosidase/alpha-galactosidase [Ruminococcaceae bacterium]|nr:alpha-glucosidase/alpha-galactosidase [Oscillospiraceae bacterium]